jgi:hypothetical protein
MDPAYDRTGSNQDSLLGGRTSGSASCGHDAASALGNNVPLAAVSRCNNEECGKREEAVFQHACRMGLEGIVSKRKDSAYRSGRSRDLAQDEEPGV